MYQIDDNTLRSILKRKFSSLVGSSLEEIDTLQKDHNLNIEKLKPYKRIVKKLNYEAMREIENQISSFSDGVKIGVSLVKSTEE